MIHIVFGTPVEGSLKFSLNDKNHKVIGFPIDFSVGPLKNGDQLTSWTCENAAEQIGLRICCYLLKNKDVELNVVNTFNAMNDLHKHSNLAILHSGECVSDDLAHFFNHSLVPISNDTRKRFAEEGEDLIHRKNLVRSWRAGELIHELETRDDALILKHTKELHEEMGETTYILVASLIGEVLGHSEQPLSDAWIEYRIRTLIQKGDLLCEGDTRMYKVKVPVVSE